MRDLFHPEDWPVVLLVWGGTILSAIIFAVLFLH